MLVQPGNRRRQLIDLVSYRGQLTVDAFVLLLHLRRQGVEAVAQRLRIGQQQLPPGGVARRPGRRLHRGKETAQYRADPGGLVGEQLVQRAYLLEVGVGIVIQRGAGLQLVIEISVIDPTHIGQGRTATDKHATAQVRGITALNGLLT
ncbi:hypothetical protein D3C86_1441480 [compost metagenome]